MAGLNKQVGDALSAIDFNSVQYGAQGNGVLSGLQVVENTNVDMNVIIQSGSGTANSTSFTVSNNLTVAVTTANTTYERIDTVSIASNGTATITDGTPAATPVPANIPANEIPLATISVPASDTTVSNSQITDRRLIMGVTRLESFYSMNSDDENITGVIYEAGIQYDNVYTGIDGEVLDKMDSTTGWSGSTDGALASGTVEIIDGDGTIALKKTGTTETFVTMDKTVTSRDFADAEDTFCVGLYIKNSTMMDKLTTTGAVILRFGSDSSNYYEWLVDKSHLVVGRQHLCTNLIVNATSTVGSPDTANMDYALVGVNTNNTSDSWSGTDDLVWDNAHVENGTIMSFTSQIGGDLELTYDVLIDGSSASVSWVQAGFILDNKLISVTKRATVISPNSTDVGARAMEVSCKAYLSGVSEGTHYLKLAFSTNDGGGLLPAPDERVDTPDDFVNYASARELITRVTP